MMGSLKSWLIVFCGSLHLAFWRPLEDTSRKHQRRLRRWLIWISFPKENWKEKIYNGSLPREESARAITKLYKKYLDEDKAYKNDGFFGYFRKAKPKARSTKQELTI
jgi:hypothetical protein